MIQDAGIKATPTIDYEVLQKNVTNLNIDSLENAYQVLLSLPFPSNEKIFKEAEQDKKSISFVSKLFSEQVKINTKGAQVAATHSDDALVSNIRGYYRKVNIAYIRIIKDALDLHGEMTKEFVYGLLEKSQSPFIPEDRLFIYAKGLYQGFNNDFLSAAHLLMPQIENILRHLAVQNGITVTSLENKIQLENLLGGVLEKSNL